MECGRCYHQWSDQSFLNTGKLYDSSIYECPACGATVPECHTIYPYHDDYGNVINPLVLERLRSLGIPGVEQHTREEALVQLFTQGPGS